MKRFVGTALALAAAHYLVQTAVWLGQGARVAVAGPLVPAIEAAGWRFLSFPLFWLAPGAVKGATFWIVGGLNSALRGVFGSVFLEAGRHGWRKLAGIRGQETPPGA